MTKERKSNVELLRLVALWMIVAYHTIALGIYQHYSDVNVLYKAIWLPLHVGVPIFVMISGYFRIKPSAKGLVKLLSYMFIYTVPLGLYDIYANGGGIFDVVKKLLFVSNSPYWFMRTYLCLYVIAPLINKLLDQSTTKQLLLAMLSLSFVAIYIGIIHFDDSLNAGKNVINFALIYVLGASVQKYELWRLFSRRTYLAAYLVCNLLEIVIYLILSGGIIGEAFFYGCFQYCSPILIMNGLFLFCYFLNLNIRSRYVNWLSGSALAIYLGHTLITHSVIYPTAQHFYEMMQNFYVFLPFVVVFTGVISIGCILFDKILSPIWWSIGKLVLPCERVMLRVSNKITEWAVFIDKHSIK